MHPRCVRDVSLAGLVKAVKLRMHSDWPNHELTMSCSTGLPVGGL
jgi:hypothetical protein